MSKRERVVRVCRPERGDSGLLCVIAAACRHVLAAELRGVREGCRWHSKAGAWPNLPHPRSPSCVDRFSQLKRRLGAAKMAATATHQLICRAFGSRERNWPPFGKLLAAVALLSASSPGYTAGWTGDLVITSAFTEANTDIIAIYTSDGLVYAPGCTANAWVFPASTAARASRGYATLLTAIATGKKVNFWFADSCGVWGFHQVTSVRIVN